MKNRIKIWFISGSSSDIREVSVSRRELAGFACIFVCAVMFLCYSAYDYIRLKQMVFNNELLTERIIAQKTELQNQRVQIKAFVGEINDLKDTFAALTHFEKQVRVMAELEKTDQAIGLFGIGGIDNETLDADIPIEQKHNSLIREMHLQTKQITQAAEKKASDFEELLGLLEKKRNLLASTPSISPVNGGWYSSKFGYRISPFTGRKEFHSGLDIVNRHGTKIVATAQGVVTYAKEKMFLGKLVTIDHGHGIVTKYGHLSKILVKPGDTIKRGDIIGLLGNTGRSTGPHVHYEVKVNGIAVNPKKYIIN
ncbi:MAG: M23 family metallopeptidase [Pseudomonadota bacterium]